MDVVGNPWVFSLWCLRVVAACNSGNDVVRPVDKSLATFDGQVAFPLPQKYYENLDFEIC